MTFEPPGVSGVPVPPYLSNVAQVELFTVLESVLVQPALVTPELFVSCMTSEAPAAEFDEFCTVAVKADGLKAGTVLYIPAARGLKLGAIQSVSFLGRQALPGKEGPKTTAADPTYLAAYAVEFADGEALCWLHQDDDGKLAAFRCA